MTKAMIHSKKALDDVEIVSQKDNNNVVAQYNGQLYSAIYNPFSGYYYVDDIYGILGPAKGAANSPEPQQRINKGYAITESFTVENAEFVLGENPNAVNPFVTWRCKNEDGEPSYFWGHYFNHREAAISDLHSRANDHREFLQSLKPPTQKHKATGSRERGSR